MNTNKQIFLLSLFLFISYSLSVESRVNNEDQEQVKVKKVSKKKAQVQNVQQEKVQVKRQIEAIPFQSKNVVKKGSMLILEEMNGLINGDMATMNLKIMSKANKDIAVSLKDVQQKLQNVTTIIKKTDNMQFLQSTSVKCAVVRQLKKRKYICYLAFQAEFQKLHPKTKKVNMFIEAMREMKVTPYQLKYKMSSRIQFLYKQYFINSAVYKAIKSAKNLAKRMKQDILGVKKIYYVMNQSSKIQSLVKGMNSNNLNNKVNYRAVLVVNFYIANKGPTFRFTDRQLQKDIQMNSIAQQKVVQKELQ